MEVFHELTNAAIMGKDYSHKNLRNASFQNEDLSYASFSKSDLRGADFTGADLRGADFTYSRTGITPKTTAWIFVLALAVSLLSGYLAMLAGQTVHTMFESKDPNVRASGIATIVIMVLFIGYSYWKGVGTAVKHLIFPAFVLAFVIGTLAYLTGAGTGMGVLYLVLSLLLVVLMFVVGTVARAAAGVLSNIVFLVVALAGGIFGRNLGGGIGSVVLAITCMQISKKALSGARGFESLRKIARYITTKFGTSFRKTTLSDADFSSSKIHNSDFSDAEVSFVNWNNSKKMNCITHNRAWQKKKV
ncbi:MAG TPA: pentapeptide repeat-containing protein [Chitinophagaceae bacterium]